MGHSGLLPRCRRYFFRGGIFGDMASQLRFTGRQDKRTNLRGLVLGAFSAKFRRKQDKLRSNSQTRRPVPTARPFTVTRLIGVSDLDKYPEASGKMPDGERSEKSETRRRRSPSECASAPECDEQNCNRKESDTCASLQSNTFVVLCFDDAV